LHERAAMLGYTYIVSLVKVLPYLKYTLKMLVGISNFSHGFVERKAADHHHRGCAPLL
jgi:hypothetical protein